MEVVVSLLLDALKRLYKSKSNRLSNRNKNPGGWRRCRIEQMESRQMLSISVPLLELGGVYIETGKGDDLTGDAFAVAFTGGADGSKLTDLTIDLNASNSNFEFCYFDPTSSFKLVSDSSNVGLDMGNIEISGDRTMLTLHFSDFNPGEKLVFTFDVDESTDSVISPLAEADEITWHDNATITGTFAAEHYYDAVLKATFSNVYVTSLGLPDDNYKTNQIVGITDATEVELVDTAGAFASMSQEPLPGSISGHIYYDYNNNGILDTGESLITGISVTVELLDSQGTVIDTINTTSGYYKFDKLQAGVYSVREATQPDGYLDGKDKAGSSGGTVGNDIISSINLGIDTDATDYDFGEIKPASISGHVYHDNNNDGVFDSETPIAGATVVLLDAEGGQVGTAATDSSGFYIFDNLMPGTYSLHEIQPGEYLDGKDSAGTSGGTLATNSFDDSITSIWLPPETKAKNYDFGELLPASISGKVHADLIRNCLVDPGEPFLSGVTIYLLDGSGNRTNISTTTDANGEYIFTGLEPGVYGVEEIQPPEYFEGCNRVGSAGGSKDGVNRIITVPLGSGVNGIHYDFCEILPATISGYVFQDGPVIKLNKDDPIPYIPSVRDGALTPDDTRLAGIVLQLCDGSGFPRLDAYGNPITTVTNAQGYYEFTGLAPDDYSIIARIPTGYIPGIDTAGSKGGLVVNRYATIDLELLNTLAVDTEGSAIVKISLNSGDAGVMYNFSVVKTVDPPDTPPFFPNPPPTIPDTPRMPVVPDPLRYGVNYTLPPIVMPQQLMGGSGGPPGYTWHLSVINGGQPRRLQSGTEFAANTQTQLFNAETWTGANLDEGGVFVIADTNGMPVKKYRFGLRGATPATGDWNGDGVTEIGVFVAGLWFMDLNGNGQWDENDLWAKLGQEGDRPVTGDWDGDGKIDIGIYGPAWFGDPKALSFEPGLPDAKNTIRNRYKNVPPEPEDATIGWRTMKRTSAGNFRSDLIDHVFRFGAEEDKPVAGDWDSDGIYAVGVFRNGTWFLDIDGDGRWSQSDQVYEFGQPGDVPIVGDWSGDGVSKLGVYRNGTFMLDTNNNHVLDATDKVFALGGPGDKPFSGDFTGSGVDTVGVYQDGGAESVSIPTPAAVPAGE
jgi:serine-aspartate repeat-containing protein C/D/E